MTEGLPERHDDKTEQSSERDKAKSTDLARRMESDDVSGFTDAGTVPSPEGDGDAENKVATSLDND